MVLNKLVGCSVLPSLKTGVSNSYWRTVSTSFVFFSLLFGLVMPRLALDFPSLHNTLIGMHRLYAGPFCAGILN